MNNEKYEFRIILNNNIYYLKLEDIIKWNISNEVLEYLQQEENKIEHFTWSFDKEWTPIFENDILYTDEWLELSNWNPSWKRPKYIDSYVIAQKISKSDLASFNICWGYHFKWVWTSKKFEYAINNWQYNYLNYMSSIIDDYGITEDWIVW